MWSSETSSTPVGLSNSLIDDVCSSHLTEKSRGTEKVVLMIQFHNISSLKKCQVLATGWTKKKDMLEMPTFVQIKQMTWHQVTPSPFPMYTRLFKRFQQKKTGRKVANHIHFFSKLKHYTKSCNVYVYFLS